ncbi:MAG: amidase [Rhodoferax sp.]|nr:amidase [Rhodoferax sp.]
MQFTGTPDLHTIRLQLRRGDTDAAAQLEHCIAVAVAPVSQHVYLKTDFEAARLSAGDPRNQARALVGLSVSVKDLFDIAGQITAAGSTVLANQRPAEHDCPAVARLKAAGAAIIGRTNMVEFAYSAVGNNPHFGTPVNAASAGQALIPGGSSSGAAVSVATGSAFIGLGSDTGGSIRIPAALNGIVGFKGTARLVPTTGAVPLSTTLDTVGALTRSVADAMLAHEILSATPVTRSLAPLGAYRMVVVRNLLQDELDAVVAKAFWRGIDRLRQGGAQIAEIELPELTELTSLNAHGGFSSAESLSWHRSLLAEHRAQYDPRVVARIERGLQLSAADYVDLARARNDWINRVEARISPYDAVLSPTVPMVAPAMADVAPGSERDAEFFRVNALLLRNTSLVNVLDGCAITIPCHQAGELPVGLMLWHAGLRDDTVLNLALQAEQQLQSA